MYHHVRDNVSMSFWAGLTSVAISPLLHVYRKLHQVMYDSCSSSDDSFSKFHRIVYAYHNKC